MTVLTRQLLGVLSDELRLYGHLFGTIEHEHLVVSLLEHAPALIAAARTTIPAPVLAEVHIPGFLPRVNLNSRGHWATKSKRIKQEREIVGLALLAGARKLCGKGELVGRVAVTQLRARLQDDDNCVGCGKSVRDSVAQFLGVDDGARGIAWSVGQEKAKRGGQGTVIRIEARK